MLMHGRCCALITAENRKRGWHIDATAIVRVNKWTGLKGLEPANDMAGLEGKPAQASVLREAGAVAAAAHVEWSGSSHTCALMLRSGCYTLLHSEALRACGFDIRVSEPLSVCGPGPQTPRSSLW